MSGYVASARIVRAAPRFAGSRPARDGATWAPAAEPIEIAIVDADAVAPDRPTLAERRDAVRERWSQLTFFLFDANSWRS